MARRQKPGMRRKAILLRDIDPPGTLATNLYRSAYLPVVQGWSNAAERIIAAYASTVAELTTDAPADVRAEIDGAAEQINRLVLLLTPEVRGWALRTEQWFRGKWRGAVLSATGVDLETMIGAGDVRASLETSIEWNVALVKDVSDVTRQKISNAVFDGLRNRTPAREVANTIRDSVGISRKRATRIASDQLNKLTSALAEERRREAGIDTWRWRWSHKKNGRQEHIERDGKEYTDATAPQDLPGRLPYCGCRSQGVITFDD